MFGNRKRSYKELQTLILKTLKKDKRTIYDIVKATNLHFHVVQHQLILLKGQDYVSLDFEYKRFKLFAITPKGLNYLGKLTK